MMMMMIIVLLQGLIPMVLMFDIDNDVDINPGKADCVLVAF